MIMYILILTADLNGTRWSGAESFRYISNILIPALNCSTCDKFYCIALGLSGDPFPGLSLVQPVT